MNLLKIQNDLRSAPDDALANYVANPQPHVPSYLALSELQRRQKMREEYQGQQGEQPSVAEEVIGKEQQGGLAAMMGGMQPQMPQPEMPPQMPMPQPEMPMPQPQMPDPTMMAQAPMPQEAPVMMAEGGLASLPIDEDLYPEEFAGGGLVAFADGGDVPGFAEGERVFSRELTQAEYDALSTRDKTAYDRQFFGKRMGRNMLKPFAAAADIVTAPVNLGLNLAEKGLNAVDFARLGRMAGVYDPDVTSVKLPGTGSMTPYYDRIRRAEMVDTETDPITGAKKDPILPNKPATMIAEENAAKIRSDLAAGKYDKKPKPKVDVQKPAVAPTVDVTEQAPLYPEQKDKSIGAYAKELQDFLGTDPTRAEGLARIARMEEQAQKQKDVAPWMALAEAGFGMAAGSSPFALQNIGTGALLGTKSYAAAQDRYQSQMEKLHGLQTDINKADRAEKVAIGKFGAESKQAYEERVAKERLQREHDKILMQMNREDNEARMAQVQATIAGQKDVARMQIDAGRFADKVAGEKGGLTEKQLYDIRADLYDEAKRIVLNSPEYAKLGEAQKKSTLNNSINKTLNELVARRVQELKQLRQGLNPSDPFGNMTFDALKSITK